MSAFIIFSISHLFSFFPKLKKTATLIFTTMTKREIVLRLSMEDAKKRSKALKTAVGITGVVSVKLDGDKIVVIGEGIDSIELVTKLRNRMGFTELVSVKPVDESKEKKKNNEESKEVTKNLLQPIWPYQYQYQATMAPQYAYETREPTYESCSIM